MAIGAMSLCICGCGGSKEDASNNEAAETELGGVQLWENGPCWAECNVGATKPEECGYYFWWGDTIGYKRNAANDGWVSVKDGTAFLFEDVKIPTWRMNASELQSQGYIDSTSNLVAAHDAATAHLGAPWRMPTINEFRDLIDKCTITWTTRNGVNGQLVTGKGAYSSKSIFLPASGFGYESKLSKDCGSSGYFLSSSPREGKWESWCLFFDSSDFSQRTCNRGCGRCVRPLRECRANERKTESSNGKTPVREEPVIQKPIIKGLTVGISGDEALAACKKLIVNWPGLTVEDLRNGGKNVIRIILKNPNMLGTRPTLCAVYLDNNDKVNKVHFWRDGLDVFFNADKLNGDEFVQLLMDNYNGIPGMKCKRIYGNNDAKNEDDILQMLLQAGEDGGRVKDNYDDIWRYEAQEYWVEVRVHNSTRASGLTIWIPDDKERPKFD